jgi:hypothetical protein
MDGWSIDPQENCFKISESYSTWGESECACQAMGTHLAYPEDEFYENFVSLKNEKTD